MSDAGPSKGQPLDDWVREMNNPSAFGGTGAYIAFIGENSDQLYLPGCIEVASRSFIWR